ncbi:Adiponectin receptor protein 2 [Tetrabaena socialis]|uniref:Adiponectin receptor protein 2 n=1 Tax=Tetrabaena socialis TaxID=47790 RepID=A0A2J7ZNC1_9CHLO|nr:Adiponectin receptor protein 2 [Tetrabaena socialis]|eukprot:PNH01757.1 Adiponectin receptor protein 2 [Tetrabaena socialis]
MVDLRTNLLVHEVPEWLRFPFILGGYRMGGDYSTCARSLFHLHNETLNAWTMLLGSVLSTASLIFVLAGYHPRGIDALPFILFWTSFVTHAPFSICYHLLLPISPAVCDVWRRLDQSFILIMSVQLTFSMSFFVYPRMWQTLLATVMVSLVSARGICMVQQLTVDQRGEVTRLVGVSALGYYAPIVVRAILDSRAVPIVAAVVVPASLVGGALLYEYHVPERFFPGKVDRIVSRPPLNF